MEAVFVTERIILLLAPEDTSDSVYRPHIKEVSSKLQADYGPHYFVMNVSEPRTDLLRLNANVMDFGWPAALAPPLEKLCSICKQADVWLNADPRNVLVVHCKGGLGRAAVLIAGYLHYTSICGSVSQARDRYAINSLFEKELQKYVTPSQRRFIQYFSGLLKGSIRICGDAVFLHAITLQQVPNFDGKAACRPSFKIYQSNDHVWTSEIYSLSEPEGRNVLTIQLRSPVQLRGDIMIKCHHHKKLRPSAKDLIFRCQLHTCAIEEGILLLTKWDLDEACNDIRFPNDGRLELTFSRSQQAFLTESRGTIFNRDAVESQRSLVGTHSQFSGKEDAFQEDQVRDHNWEQNQLDQAYHYQELPPLPLGGAIPQTARLVPQEPPTYAKINKKRPPLAPLLAAPAPPSAPKANLHEELEITPPSSSLLHKSAYQRHHLSNSFDSGISAVVADQEGSSGSKMERRTVSPGGTIKSVKFRDGLEEQLGPAQDNFNWRSPPPSTNLKNGMDVVDLDAMQPELDELDRVFESLQAETESLDRMTSKGQVAKVKSSSASQSESRPPPLRQQNSLTRQDSTSSQTKSDDQTTPQQPDSGLISGYVPHDRKGYAKKFGAFTFGLPTGKPELKSISSPPPVRRGSRSTSDTEATTTPAEEKYGRGRLRPIQDQGGSFSDSEQRKRAEEKLYSSAAPAPSRNIRSSTENGAGSLERRLLTKPPITSSVVNEDVSHYDTISSQPPRPVISTSRITHQREEEQLQRSLSPPVPRPRTPTEDERLARLLNIEQREFIVTSPDEKGKPRLKEIAREYQEERRVVQMESEGVQTDPEDESPIPERKKQKRATDTQTTETRPRPDAETWLQIQHDKLMTKRFGPDHLRRRNREDALLREIKDTHQRMIEQVPNRDMDENRLPLSSIILREAKTPPLSRKHSPEVPGYAVVKKQVSQVTSKMSVDRERKAEKERPGPTPPAYSQIQRQTQPAYQPQIAHSENVSSSNQGSLRMIKSYPDSDHDSLADEVDFADEPLYKSPPASLLRQSRSREIDDSRLRQVDMNRASFSNPTSPDILRKSNASPKSILKNASLQRSRNATSEDRSGLERERPTTPNFPPEKSASFQRNYSLYGTRDRSSGRSTPTGYFGLGSRRSSLTSLNNGNAESDDYIIHHHPIFVRDLSRFWYKPQITREEAITMLRDKPSGTFLIRDSNSFPGAYGLALKVDVNQLPAGTSAKGSDELVRHFLIEPSPKGVHLKGCANEPIFGSLPALVYQHSVTPLALPCKLLLPDSDINLANQPLYSEDTLQRLMETGAACNVFYLICIDTESLTGPQAIRRAMSLVSQGQTIRPTIVHFKVNSTGIILTDNKRKLFFRRHYPINTISFCGLDPDDRRWSFKLDEQSPVVSARCFGFVSRKRSTRNQNECHIFAELEDDQPAGAVVSFVTKVMMSANSQASQQERH